MGDYNKMEFHEDSQITIGIFIPYQGRVLPSRNGTQNLNTKGSHHGGFSLQFTLYSPLGNPMGVRITVCSYIAPHQARTLEMGIQNRQIGDPMGDTDWNTPLFPKLREDDVPLKPDANNRGSHMGGLSEQSSVFTN